MIINDTLFNAELYDIIEELRSQLAINNIPYLQKEPKRSGNSLQVQCPYHGDGQERKPSAGIRLSDGMFHCFACNAVHTLPELISHCFGHEEDIFGKEGWKWLIKNFATLEVEERKDVELDFSRNINSRALCSNSRNADNNSNNDRYVSELELDSYRYYHPYWKKRGIVDDDIIELFDLGFDKKTNCITFPIRDINGNCLFVARRNVKTKFFHYPEGVEKPLYGLYELTRSHSTEIFVCESMIDCILLWQAGFTAVALNGTGNELQFKQLRDLSCRKLVLATDNDNAGYKARERLRKYVKGKLFTEIQFPEGIKDIGECSAEQIKNIKKFEIF